MTENGLQLAFKGVQSESNLKTLSSKMDNGMQKLDPIKKSCEFGNKTIRMCSGFFLLIYAHNHIHYKIMNRLAVSRSSRAQQEKKGWNVLWQ